MATLPLLSWGPHGVPPSKDVVETSKKRKEIGETG